MQLKEFEVQFNKEGQMIQPAQEQAITGYLASSAGAGVTDVVVISHGWNNDMDDARTLYRNFFRNLVALVPENTVNVVAIEILWPSKRYAVAELIPGGAASADHDTLQEEALRDQLEALKSLFGDHEADVKIEQLQALVPEIENNPDKQREFVRILGEIVQQQSSASVKAEPGEGSLDLATKDGADLLELLKMPVTPPATVDNQGGAAGIDGDLGGNPALAAGGAAGIGGFFNNIKSGAMQLLNITTYYTMKDRAGLVGTSGVNPMLQRIQSTLGAGKKIRFHLVGHSFGGRLVTAIVNGPNKLQVHTLFLMQAAFSHNGFAGKFDAAKSKDGFFRKVVAEKRVTGPILVTHSRNDQAVGLAYPLASRINQENAAGFGEADDEYGGIGRNGAQRMTAAEAKFLTLLPIGHQYDWSGGFAIFNLNGDTIIQEHSDITRPETAQVLAQAIRMAR